MKTPIGLRALTAFALVAVTIAALSVVVRTPGDLHAQSKHYGFIDMQHVLDNYQKNAELTAKFTSDLKTAFDQMKTVEEAIQLEREELGTLRPGSTKHGELQRSIAIKEMGFDYDQKLLARRVDAKRADMWRELYSGIQTACEQVAKQRGLDAVLTMSRSLPDGATEQEAQAQITVRPVIYFDKSLDVTADVLAVLNGQGC